MYLIRRQVFPTLPSPTTTNLMEIGSSVILQIANYLPARWKGTIYIIDNNESKKKRYKMMKGRKYKYEWFVIVLILIMAMNYDNVILVDWALLKW
jgi:hypothetical protein